MLSFDQSQSVCTSYHWPSWTKASQLVPCDLLSLYCIDWTVDTKNQYYWRYEVHCTHKLSEDTPGIITRPIIGYYHNYFVTIHPLSLIFARLTLT